MDPVLSTALAGLITTLQAILLMYAVYHWPQGHNEHDDHMATKVKKHSKKDDEEESTDDDSDV